MDLPLCSLCLFKIELIENEIEMDDNTNKLKEILNDLFSNKIKLTENALRFVCQNCRDKLESFHEYYLFVLDNQLKSNEISDELKKSGTSGPEFVNVIKVEPDVVLERQIDVSEDDSSDRMSLDEEHDDKTDEIESVKDDSVEKSTAHSRNPNTRKRKYIRKTTPKQQEQKEMIYNAITEFYDMTCDACKDTPVFSSYALLIRHYRKIHNGLRVFICCNLRLYTTTKLYEHSLKHKNPNTCRHCGDQFTENRAFKQHKCPKAKYMICNECGKQCVSKSTLRDHLKVHFPDYIFCELCGKSFTKKYKFREHMKYDHGNLPMEELFRPCPICGILISTRNYGMKDHIRERHEKPSRGPSICEQCNKEYTNEKNLKRHVREEHTFGRKHQCRHCSKRFLNVKSLKEHEAIHTGLPNYICEFCTATFKSNGNFYSHKRRLHPVEYAAQKANRKAMTMIKKSESNVMN